MSRVSRKEDQFYEKFKEMIAAVCSGADSYASATRNYPDKSYRISEVKSYERNVDDLARQSYRLLDTSFITPFDREDISALIHMLDEIVDEMESVSVRFEIFNIEKMRPEAIKLAEMTARACHELKELFDHFSGFKKDSVVIDKAEEVLNIENEGDIIYRNALAALFHEGVDPIEVIKWKSLLDKMEDTLDACKGVANIVRGVVMKNA